MKENLSEIVLIVDTSGSMHSLHNDTVGGINSFIEVQKKEPGNAYVSIVLFNTQVNTLIESQQLDTVELLKKDSFADFGCTALYDAVGYTIDNVGERLANLKEEERPSKVIIAILTDGFENSSTKYDQKTVAEKIKHQREVYKWDFMFLAANQDAWAGATMLNINPNLSFTYTADSAGVTRSYNAVSAATSSLRAGSENVSISNN